MKDKIPYTIGYDLNKALLMLADYEVVVEETSTPFQDKQKEREQNTPIVVRQLETENSVRLTVSKFK